MEPNLTLDQILSEWSEHKFFGIILNKAMSLTSEKLKSKVIEIVRNLNSSKINFKILRKLISDGLPDDIPSLRSLVWKLLLNYISLNADEWEQAIDKKRSEYSLLKKKLFTELDLDKINKSEKRNSKKSKSNHIDHPLSLVNDSKWKSYFDDLDLLEEIDKDVRRTRTHMHFFFMPSKTNPVSVSTDKIIQAADKKKNDPGTKETVVKSFETNADVMSRILFIYAKKHPEVRYVQGMNEILAPIFYCFSTDQNPYFIENLEADSFMCFENLMSEIKDIFIRSLDDTETGIHTRLKNLFEILKLVDKEIFTHFIDEKVEIQYFAFRWYTLFFTQEFEMPDILRLWDSLLTEEDKFEFINMMCLAIIKLKKIEILQTDFSGIMLSLQSLEKLDVERIIKTGESIHVELNKHI